jgi:hypothetical protein
MISCVPVLSTRCWLSLTAAPTNPEEHSGRAATPIHHCHVSGFLDGTVTAGTRIPVGRNYP